MARGIRLAMARRHARLRSRQWHGAEIGDDGYTDAERAELARRWEEGVGSPGTQRDLELLKRVTKRAMTHL